MQYQVGAGLEPATNGFKFQGSRRPQEPGAHGMCGANAANVALNYLERNSIVRYQVSASALQVATPVANCLWCSTACVTVSGC
jgi:hypothetical protein